MLKTTTVGSYPRKNKPKDTLRKPTVSEEEALDMVKWAVEDQCNLGLDILLMERPIEKICIGFIN